MTGGALRTSLSAGSSWMELLRTDLDRDPHLAQSFCHYLDQAFCAGSQPPRQFVINKSSLTPAISRSWMELLCRDMDRDPHLASCFCLCYHVDLGKSFGLGHSPQDNLSVTNDLSHIGNLALTTIAAQRPFLLLFVYTLTLTSFVCHALL